MKKLDLILIVTAALFFYAIIFTCFGVIGIGVLIILSFVGMIPYMGEPSFSKFIVDRFVKPEPKKTIMVRKNIGAITELSGILSRCNECSNSFLRDEDHKCE